MNVNLTPELEALVIQKVQSGMYNSASEVVRHALRLLSEQDEYRRARLDELRFEVMRGIDGSENGLAGPIDFEAIKAEGRKQRAARKTQK